MVNDNTRNAIKTEVETAIDKLNTINEENYKSVLDDITTEINNIDDLAEKL